MHSIYFTGYLYPYNPHQLMCNTTLDTGYALLWTGLLHPLKHIPSHNVNIIASELLEHPFKKKKKKSISYSERTVRTVHFLLR